MGTQISRWTGIDVYKNQQVKTGKQAVSRGTGSDGYKNQQFKTEKQAVSRWTGRGWQTN